MTGAPKYQRSESARHCTFILCRNVVKCLKKLHRKFPRQNFTKFRIACVHFLLKICLRYDLIDDLNDYEYRFYVTVSNEYLVDVLIKY